MQSSQALSNGILYDYDGLLFNYYLLGRKHHMTKIHVSILLIG